jgi:hypothetical protein
MVRWSFPSTHSLVTGRRMARLSSRIDADGVSRPQWLCRRRHSRAALSEVSVIAPNPDKVSKAKRSRTGSMVHRRVMKSVGRRPASESALFMPAIQALRLRRACRRSPQLRVCGVMIVRASGIGRKPICNGLRLQSGMPFFLTAAHQTVSTFS